MSLSDKIERYEHLHKLLRVEDVKEAVKELKKELKDWELKDSLHTVLALNIEGEMIDKIDKIFGEKLI